jgi:predicted phage gp36 major capsid-like protein
VEPTPGPDEPALLVGEADLVGGSVSTITTGSKILAMGDFRYFVIVDGNRHGY